MTDWYVWESEILHIELRQSWFIISDGIQKMILIRQAFISYNHLTSTHRMSDYTPSILRKHAFWQKNLVKIGIFQESSVLKGDYQAKKKGIFASEGVIASVDRKKDRESLRQRRRKVDCQMLAKEGMELMSLWAGYRSKRQLNQRELELMKEDLSLVQQVAHTSFGISQRKDEIIRTLSLHQQQLSADRKVQIEQSCNLESKGKRISSERKSPITTPTRTRASSLVRPSPVRTEQISRLSPLPEYLTPWQAPDSPSLPF